MMKILFQGDSITDGMRYKDPANAWDKNHQIGHSYLYVINALLGSRFPERGYEFINRGISGNKVLDLLNRWETDAIEINPDVLSILIGTNDVCYYFPEDAEDLEMNGFRERYDTILSRSREKNPALRLILLEPFGYVEEQEAEGTVEIRTTKLRNAQRIVRELAEKYHAVFVPLQEVFDKAREQYPSRYWIWDGIHPTEAGHGLIAEEWLRATKDWFGYTL
jgi:lysophospholipase L1-like esterase